MSNPGWSFDEVCYLGGGRKGAFCFFFLTPGSIEDGCGVGGNRNVYPIVPFFQGIWSILPVLPRRVPQISWHTTYISPEMNGLTPLIKFSTFEWVIYACPRFLDKHGDYRTLEESTKSSGQRDRGKSVAVLILMTKTRHTQLLGWKLAPDLYPLGFNV